MSPAAAPVEVISITRQDLERLVDQVLGSNLPEEARTLTRSILQAYGDLVHEIGDKNASLAALKRRLSSPTLFGACIPTKMDQEGCSGPPPGGRATSSS